jgi:hypothetical protein
MEENTNNTVKKYFKSENCEKTPLKGMYPFERGGQNSTFRIEIFKAICY